MPFPITAEQLAAARARIDGRVHRTPLHGSTQLGERIGASLYLKCENFQKTGSFKVRGALNRILTLPDEQRTRGVVTISAGNHAQALGWAAREAGIPCTVVMPAAASPTKAEASRGYGAEVILHGNTHEAFDKAFEIERERGLRFVHPFDDPETVAGHASAGLEILEDLDSVAAIVVPIGGGGQISGIAAAVKHHRPEVKVYGVEPEGACAMRKSLDAGRAVRIDTMDTIADGLAPPMAGELNYEIVRDAVEDVVLVTDDEILDAMGLLLSRTKLVAEPSGAASTAALLTGRIPLPTSGTVVAVVSGGNVNLDLLPEYATHWKTAG